MKVYHTLQTPGFEPVTYAYTRDTDAINVVAAVASLLSMDFSDVPESARPETLSITIKF